MLFDRAKSDYSIDLVGVGLALLLVLLARWLLPAGEKKMARLPALFLGLGVAFGLAAAATNDKANVDRFLHFLYAFFLLASCGRSLVLLAVDVLFGRRTHRAPPRIFRDLTQAIVYVVVLMLTLRAIGVEPGSLLTTSALLTAVVGLALQDTLGNMVSGLALQMQRPFEVGDFIQFDGDARQTGQVTEVNWRAITVMTNDLVEVIVPNSLLAKAPIRNFSRPSTLSRRHVTVQGPYGVPPKKVHEAILSALGDTPGVLAEPAPFVQTAAFADSGIEYGIFFFIRDFGDRERIDGTVRDRVWYALQRATIEIPFPHRTVQLHTMSEEASGRARDRELARRDSVLRCVDFLEVLPPEAHGALAAATTLRLYAPGEVIVEQGSVSNEMFVIDRGTAVVELTRGDSPVEVARLGPGKFFGEMALMTGEARRATVRAASECELLVIGHDAFQSILAKNPEVVDKMSDLLGTRQAELEAANSSRRPPAEPPEERSKRLISQIRNFFKV